MSRKVKIKNSIVNNLILWLTITVVILMILINFLYLTIMTNRITTQLEEKSSLQISNIAHVLSSPLWNMDLKHISEIANAYIESDDIAGIKITDNTITNFQKKIYDKIDRTKPGGFLLKRDILHNKQKIGEVQIQFSRSEIKKTERLINLSFGLAGFSVILILLFLTNIILKNQLKEPINNVVQDLNSIASGNYQNRMRNQHYIEFQKIIDAANFMADKIEIRDTRIKNSLKEINFFKEYFFTIINVMPSALIGLDRELKINLMNQKARKLFRIQDPNIEGINIYEIIPRIQSFHDTIKDSIQNNMTHTIKKNKILVNSKKTYEKITIYPFSTTKEKGVILLFDDITNIVQMEQMMIQSEKMLSVGGLAAGMAHEINNPIAGMLQNASVLKNRLLKKIPKNLAVARKHNLEFDQLINYIKERKIDKLLNLIAESGSHASEIIKTMLSFARSSKNISEKYDLLKILEDTIILIQNDYSAKKNYDFKKIALIRNYPESLPQVTCDSGQIEQVIFNLFKNSAEAMAEVPRENYKPKISITVSANDNEVVIKIADNGPGIPEDIKNKIFDPFFTTKPVDKGTGLGLSVSYFIITQNHNGSIKVDSGPRQGTCFTIKLPILD
ncbi:MAG: sensor histidine kinase [Fidelibacterota bacterium]